MQRVIAVNTSGFLLLHMLLGCCAHHAHAVEPATVAEHHDHHEHQHCPADHGDRDGHEGHADCRVGCVFVKSETSQTHLPACHTLAVPLALAIGGSELGPSASMASSEDDAVLCGKVPACARPLVLRC